MSFIQRFLGLSLHQDDYKVIHTRISVRRLTLMITLIFLATLITEIVFDLESTSVKLLLPFLLLNICITGLTFMNSPISLLKSLQTGVLLLTLEVHFILSPSSYHVLVYWMPFIPAVAMLISGRRQSIKWLLVVIGLNVVNGLYGISRLGVSYTQELAFGKFMGASILYGLAAYGTLFLLYYLLEQAYGEVSSHNAKIEDLNGQLTLLNQELEKRVDQRTKEVVEQYNLLSEIAYNNSHEIRAPLANIQAAVDVIRSQGYSQEMSDIIWEESRKLDGVLRLNSDLTQREDEK